MMSLFSLVTHVTVTEKEYDGYMIVMKFSIFLQVLENLLLMPVS
jgi:hypothetical protein